MMRAVRIHRFGGPDVLSIDAIARPAPQDGEVLVRLTATSVNPVDYKIREGKFPPVRADMLPVTLGRDVAGVVEACGSGVTQVAAGDRVYGMPGFEHGTYAQYCVTKAGDLAPAPATLPDADAGCVPLAALTAWQGLFRHAGLAAGQCVLVHGAGGGVGHFAVQFAAAHGAEVIATA